MHPCTLEMMINLCKQQVLNCGRAVNIAYVAFLCTDKLNFEDIKIYKPSSQITFITFTNHFHFNNLR